MGSIFGDLFTVSTFGESHGAAIGCVIDGCPAGLALDPQDFAIDMARRAPGKMPHTSARKEVDEVEIFSGVFGGITTGAPIALIIFNRDQRPEDYDALARVFRPGHGDFTHMSKYGIRDHRGGGRASGRETAARVAAGVVAKKILAELGITVAARVSAIGHIEIDGGVDFAQNKAATALLENCVAAGDSIGSAITGKISGRFSESVATEYVVCTFPSDSPRSMPRFSNASINGRLPYCPAPRRAISQVRFDSPNRPGGSSLLPQGTSIEQDTDSHHGMNSEINVNPFG